jgi:superfamily I DNA/RNA helicase
LIDIVGTRLAKGERIAVLFPQQRQAYGYAKGLQEAGIDVENPKELNFTTDKPKLMPYHSAKGLTFDTVVLPRLVSSAFGRTGAQRIPRVLFVGITRATKWIYLSTVDGNHFEPLNCLVNAGADGFLTIRQGTDVQPKVAQATQEDSSDDVLDLL